MYVNELREPKSFFAPIESRPFLSLNIFKSAQRLSRYQTRPPQAYPCNMSFDNIKVVVRVRPLNSREQNLDYGIGWQTDASSVTYYHPETKKVNPSIKYTFGKDLTN